MATNLPAGTFRVTVTDANGCPATETVDIDEPDALVLGLTTQAVDCFEAATGSAAAVVTGGVGPYQLQWSNGAQGATVTGLSAGTISLTVEDRNGCVHVDSIEVRQPGSAVEGQATVRDVRCFGGSDGRITITGSGGTPPYRYALDNRPWNGSSVQIGLKAGSYTPRIMDNNGCVFDLPAIEVSQRSQLTIDLGPDLYIELGRDTQLLAEILNAAGPLVYAWSAEDSAWLSCLDCPDPLVTGLQFQNTFELEVVDSMGCAATDQVRVVVEKPRRIHVPTGFTPNGDFNNDLLVVHGQESAHVLSFQVYDRWGEIVYETKDFSIKDAETAGWDGRFRGEDLDPGVYVWILEVRYVDGVTEVFRGNTTLIR
jgi:gliding motility-associated-like protein